MERPRRPPTLTLNRGEQAAEGNEDKTIRRTADKVGRNDPCPCGSGKKYKKCHGT
jgi:preprotein translocase subunit SecA